MVYRIALVLSVLVICTWLGRPSDSAQGCCPAGPRGKPVVNADQTVIILWDAANKTQLGTDQGFCVRTVVGKSWECFWTLTLKTGQITIEGPFSDVGDSLFSITGGTGKYAGAKGSMTLHPRDAKGSSYDFTYDLL